MTNQLGMNFADARIELPRPGATTWRKGERCTVLAADAESR